MSASISQLRIQTVVVAPDDLRKLDNSLRTFGGEPSYEVECADKITRRFSTLDELLSFENPPNKDIRVLRMKTFTTRNKTTAAISFENTTLLPPIVSNSSANTPGAPRQRGNIWISIEGEEQHVVNLLHDLEDRLVAMKPRYSLMSRLDPLSTSVIVLFASFILLIIFAYIYISPVPPNSTGTTSPITGKPVPTFGAVIIALIIILPLLLGIVLWLAQRALYPIAAFRIGQGEKRYKDKDFVRSVVIIGFVVSLLASLVAAPILGLFGLGH
jgi:hypothetical protein